MILEISCARAVSPRSRPRTRCSEVLISRGILGQTGALSGEISWTEELPMTCTTKDPNQAPEDIEIVDIAGRTIVVIAT